MRRRDYWKREDCMHFSRKEKTMLNMLLKNGRTFNTSIAKRLKISSQLTGRIRRKLEKEGIIKEYSINLNNRFLGLQTFALVLFNIEGSYEKILEAKNLISFYRVISNSTTHIGLYGFRNLKEYEDYFTSFIEYLDGIKIINSHVFSINSILKYSPKNLFWDAIKGFEGQTSSQFRSFNKRSYQRKRIKDLSNSEKEVLKSLIKNTKSSCKKISSNLNIKITRNGVNKIKSRLEDKRIIQGYDIKLDYEKLGINVLAFIFVTPLPEILKYQEEMTKKCRKLPMVIGCFRLNEETALFCGFKNLNELENYCFHLKTDYFDRLKVKSIRIISPRGVIKESFDDLYLSLLV